jgi:hypothetical protein
MQNIHNVNFNIKKFDLFGNVKSFYFILSTALRAVQFQNFFHATSFARGAENSKYLKLGNLFRGMKRMGEIIKIRKWQGQIMCVSPKVPFPRIIQVG